MTNIERLAVPKTAEDVVEFHQYLTERNSKATDLFENKVGEVIWDFAQCDDVTTKDIGEILIAKYLAFQTAEEFNAAEGVLIALLGQGIVDILAEVEGRDERSYKWICKKVRGC